MADDQGPQKFEPIVPDAALRRLGGVAGRRELLRLTSRRMLDAALAAGTVRRAGPNLYALPVVDAATLAARQVNGVVSHLSAAMAWGWKVKTAPRLPVVSIPRNHHRPARRDMDVFYATLARADVIGDRTAPVRTVLDCARSLPFDEALAVCDSALRSGKVTKAALRVGALSGPRTGRSAALRLIEASSGEAANPFESVLRAIAIDVIGFSPVAQGSVGPWHADVADLQLKIAVEAESFEFHALPEAFRHDIRRYTDMTRRGWLVVRFVWEDVMHKPHEVHAVLSDLVALREDQRPSLMRHSH